ncbi:P-loop containing nucleoside triphosphate hydrolase protein [Mycena albidolilacea]|uniref:P-loop containing nucleoside triphosphate hydrolase protein n=1 Tax=Mycena albidolilacea TaxID=1033008 RepID=A0AAD6ZSH7_9AGAR|nr:P-loop containing nucleoside triphosphate hydrolase protein [Mycena albidolilacea]
MPSLIVDDAPVNGVDAAAVTTNGVKVNGIHAEEPAVTPIVPVPTPDVPVNTPSTSEAAVDTPEKKEEETKTDDESDDEKEMKARKKELDALNAEYKDVAHGSKTELIHLDKRWDKNGDEYYVRQKKAESRTPGGDWWEKHVLVVIRHFDEGEPEKVEQTTVEVYSGYLRKTLAKVIGTYPSISFRTEHICLTLPAECLYHYLSELRAEAETLQEGSVELEHLNILLDFIETQFANTIESVNNLRPQNLVSYDTLWTLFRPGTIIHSKIRGYDRAFKLQSYYTVRCGQHVGFYSLGSYMDYDGENFGTRAERLKIPPFAGSMAIPALPFAPLEMRNRKDEIRAALMKRGERFQSMRGQCHGEYVGVAMEQGEEADKKFSIKSRVMIDGTSYNRICADYSWEAPEDEEAAEALFWAEDSLSAEEFAAFKAKMAAEKAARSLTEEEILLATNVLRGFSFSEKKWFLLFIDNYSEIVWNEASFDRLVLPEASKTLVRALVSSHLRVEDSKFDDIIKGKGRGLVTVLHGSPGVGKTLTAECIAEYTRRPLYVVSSGDLGTSASNLEHELTRILDLAHTWRAVLLIDEADVFLEKRTLTDVHRNALVSVFLRLLEYYEGILFLTTNRVNTFDPAFQSRIHMALKYENLEAQARKRLWKDFLSKLNDGAGADVSEEGYDALAQYDINGRQIKNAVKTAESLASFMEKPLNLEYLETVLKTQADFAEAFVGNEF